MGFGWLERQMVCTLGSSIASDALGPSLSQRKLVGLIGQVE